MRRCALPVEQAGRGRWRSAFVGWPLRLLGGAGVPPASRQPRARGAGGCRRSDPRAALAQHRRARAREHVSGAALAGERLRRDARQGRHAARRLRGRRHGRDARPVPRRHADRPEPHPEPVRPARRLEHRPHHRPRARARVEPLDKDGTTYEVKLRRASTFHNGKTFGAEDVIYSIQQMAKKNSAGAAVRVRTSASASMKAIDKLDACTSRCKRRTPTCGNFAYYNTWIVQNGEIDYSKPGRHRARSSSRRSRPGQQSVFAKQHELLAAPASRTSTRSRSSRSPTTRRA